MNISALLNELENILIDNNAIVYNFLNPGVNPAYIRHAMDSLDLKLPNDFYELYKWKNGVTATDENSATEELIPFGSFYSIDEAIEVYQFNSIQHSYIDKRYFPLFTNDTGDYYLINTDYDDLEYGMICYYSPPVLLSKNVLTRYDSIFNLFETLITCLKQGVYFYENGRIELDYEQEIVVSKKINPRSNYWKNPQ